MILSTKKKIPHEKRSPAQEKQNPAPSVNALPLLITATRFRKATSESSQHESGSKEDDSQDQKTNPPRFGRLYNMAWPDMFSQLCGSLERDC